MTLDQAIEQRTPEIVRRFIDEVRRRGFPAYSLPDHEVSDELHEYLSELVAALRTGHAATAEANETAKAHGEQRWHIGYDLRSIVTEYGLLREVILTEVARAGVVPTIEEVGRLGDFLIAGISEAAIALVQKREEQIQEAVRARDDVLSIVSHDLRNPLGSVVTAAELLRRSLPSDQRSERVQRAIATIQRAADRMTHLVDDLLDLGSIESGQLRVHPKPEPVDEIVRDVVDAFRSSAEEHGVSLASDLPADLPLVQCDRERIFQVFSNLLGNALKVAPAQTSVTIKAERQDGFVCFSVSDQGPGIESGNVPHVFDRYWRGYRASGKGRGLGLSIVKGLVEAHRGSAGVESSPGKGSTFFFTIPIAPSG